MRLKFKVKQLLKRLHHTIPSHSPAAREEGQSFDRVAAQQAYTASESRDYRVYVPGSYRIGKPTALIMVLHGCQQNHLDIQAISQFDALADQHGFIVVYPFVTRYTDMRTRNCWGWWRREHVSPGSGEVQDLWHIVEAVGSEFSVDPLRIHITGISSGGCMAVAALTVHPNRFASGAAVAALAYGEGARAAISLPFSSKRRYRPLKKTVALMQKVRNNDRTPTPLLIIHSHGDKAVHLQAATDLRDSWLMYFGVGNPFPASEQQGITHGTPWTHTRYGAAGASLVETLFLQGLPHGWYGGAPGKYSYPAAPPTAELIWQFFSEHPRSQAGALNLELQPKSN